VILSLTQLYRYTPAYGAVAVYIKETVHYERKTDLEINGLVCLGGAQNEKPKSSVWYFNATCVFYN
jgi:hypothetical protein